MKSYQVTVNGRTVRVESVSKHGSLIRFRVAERTYEVDIQPILTERSSSQSPPLGISAGFPTAPKIAPLAQTRAQADALKAPMPGIVATVLVKEGQEVNLQQPLLVIEAMKMENNILSPRSGVVKKVHVSLGVEVENGQLLVSFE